MLNRGGEVYTYYHAGLTFIRLLNAKSQMTNAKSVKWQNELQMAFFSHIWSWLMYSKIRLTLFDYSCKCSLDLSTFINVNRGDAWQEWNELVGN